MRGIAACPVISSLESCEVLKHFKFGPVTVASFPNLRPERLTTMFTYLESLGLLETNDKGFIATDLGRSVFSRAGTFQILTSYHPHFENLEDWLTGSDRISECNRRLNVAGSGSIHRKKFFPTATAWVSETPFDMIVDLGCGDGAFLEMTLDQDSKRVGVCVDLSSIAVDETISRLQGRPVQGVISDAFDIDIWSRGIDPSKRCLISLWFVLHEFCHNGVEQAVEFLHKIRNRLPRAELIIGEIVALPSHLLTRHRSDSIMPEFLLFHKLSGQNVLSWQELTAIERRSTYRTLHHAVFDVIGDVASPDEETPSAAIWHLTPE